MRRNLPDPIHTDASPSSPRILQILDGAAKVLWFVVRAAFVAVLLIGVVGCYVKSSSDARANTGASSFAISSDSRALISNAVSQPSKASETRNSARSILGGPIGSLIAGTWLLSASQR